MNKPSPRSADSLILGIDPGSRHTGFAFLQQRGERLRAIEYGTISPPTRLDLPTRLAGLTTGLRELLDRWQPQAAALETPFHGINSRSLVVLAQARGALLSVLAERQIEIYEYSPAEVKQAVTGSGRADKAQVAKMVRMLLTLRDERLGDDTTDALATAICLAHRAPLDRLSRQTRDQTGA